MSRRPSLRQRGVAVVTALLLTTLAVSIVASLFWQQQVQVRSMENQRLHFQTRWILRGGLDLVRLVLRQDFYNNQRITRADGIWATPLAETRLDQFIERERVQNESFDATIAGQTYDAQARYNLANLASGRFTLPAQVAVFQRLLQNLQLNASLAQSVAEQVARSQALGARPGSAGESAQPVAAGSGEPMALMRVEDLLEVSGFTRESIEKLRDFVIVLPVQAKVNVNTAPAEVLSALTDLTLSEAQSLVLSRQRTAFTAAQSFRGYLANMSKNLRVADEDITYASGYFLVLSRVRLDRAELVSWSLISRDVKGATNIVWIREI